MSLIVQKFGGSSVADAEKLLHIAHITKAAYDAGNDVIVVVSAQGAHIYGQMAKYREKSALQDWEGAHIYAQTIGKVRKTPLCIYKKPGTHCDVGIGLFTCNTQKISTMHKNGGDNYVRIST